MSRAPLRVAILGATGHVGKVLAHLLPRPDTTPLLVARDPARALAVAESAGVAAENVIGFEQLASHDVDALVNCTGIGDPARLARAGVEIHDLTRRFDDSCLGYLAQRPETVYINISSGAVYGTCFDEPASDETLLELDVNAIGPQDQYTIAKLAAEARHRAMPDAQIVDLRLFGLYSRYLDLDASYLINAMVRCALSGEAFVTDDVEITRDFIHPDDLAALVAICASGDVGNTVLDIATGAPVTKTELLRSFSDRYGLRYELAAVPGGVAATGRKPAYYSTSRRAWETGWEPRYPALDAVIAEADHVVTANRGPDA